MRIVSVYLGGDSPLSFLTRGNANFEIRNNVTDKIYVPCNSWKEVRIFMSNYTEIDGHNIIYGLTDEEFALLVLTYA